MTIAQRLHDLVAPLLADLGIEIYDLEYVGGTLRITVDRPGGIDLEAIALATRVVSRELDHSDPLPGHYTLEVSSPGLERSLRTPEHFRRALGSTVALRTHPHVEGERRAQGILREVDDDGIIVFVTDGLEPGERRLAFDEVERARTVFTWGPTPKPGSTSRAKRPAATQSKQPIDSQRKAGAS
jgi:ribosome maturation factor RimP